MWVRLKKKESIEICILHLGDLIAHLGGGFFGREIKFPKECLRLGVKLLSCSQFWDQLLTKDKYSLVVHEYEKIELLFVLNSYV